MTKDSIPGLSVSRTHIEPGMVLTYGTRNVSPPTRGVRRGDQRDRAAVGARLLTQRQPASHLVHVLVPARDRRTDAEGSGAETAESLLRFFGAERVLTLPLPECALPTSAWLGFGSSAPLSDAQAAAVDAATRRAAAVLDGDEPLDSKLDRLRRLDAAAEMVTALTDALDVRDVFDRVATIAKSVLEHDALSLAFSATI